MREAKSRAYDFSDNYKPGVSDVVWKEVFRDFLEATYNYYMVPLEETIHICPRCHREVHKNDRREEQQIKTHYVQFEF